MNEKDLVLWMKLTQVHKLGPRKIEKLFDIFSSFDIFLSASKSELFRTRIFNEEMLQEWEKLKCVADENFLRAIQDCKDNFIEIVTLIDKEYPINLKLTSYPPLTLYLKGDKNLLQTRKVAMVGSRMSGEEAKKWAYNNARILAEKDITVVSGGAIGIDTAAHKGALDVLNGKTISVLGSGFLKLYPEENINLFNEISKKGLLISEHLPRFPGSRISFIQRNRITSGISDALIMVASGARGGSMVQTKMAFEQRVPIFCPLLGLNLTPNEGLIQIVKEWNGKEIESVNQLFNCEKSDKSESECKNMSLEKFI
ncbi:MAG: DNA-processing protein DprA [archaeon]